MLPKNLFGNPIACDCGPVNWCLWAILCIWRTILLALTGWWQQLAEQRCSKGGGSRSKARLLWGETLGQPEEGRPAASHTRSRDRTSVPGRFPSQPRREWAEGDGASQSTCLIWPQPAEFARRLLSLDAAWHWRYLVASSHHPPVPLLRGGGSAWPLCLCVLPGARPLSAKQKSCLVTSSSRALELSGFLSLLF